MISPKKHYQWWAIPLILLLLPLLIIAVVFWGLYSISLYFLVWTCWLTRGRDVLFVYSDSPHWKHYIEEEILPRIRHRSIVLNWSERRRWLHKVTLAAMVFRHFGGYREFNPIALYFRPLWLNSAYRFWDPIRKWRKKDDKSELDALLARFYSDLGI